VPDEHDDGHVPLTSPPPVHASDDPISDDWLLRAIERVEETGRLAAAALTRSLENVSGVRQQREAGVPVDTIVGRMLASGGPEARRATEEAFHRYQHAVMVLRALMIRALVDDSGSSLSEVAREMNISRQKVTQLYRIGRSLAEAPEGE
jgi:uncharacterized alpha-E superfamily protein